MSVNKDVFEPGRVFNEDFQSGGAPGPGWGAADRLPDTLVPTHCAFCGVQCEMSDIVLGLFHRFQLTRLVQYHNSTVVLTIFSLVNGLISIPLMSAVALITRAPFIFPSLGPTAFLLFYIPIAPSASPRITIVGHLIGALAGWLSLVIFGLTAAPPALSAGVSEPRVGAAALSLALTSFFMVLLRVPHPPAGATTLIVSLGLLPHPWQLGVLMVAVGILTLQGFGINRLAGIDYPAWAPRPAKE